jgi:nucleoid-associated protein YgaU
VAGPGQVGFWVDEIIDVMGFPTSGWGSLPVHLPKGIFTRTLILNNKIYLYAEFSQLYRIPNSGYLRIYIEKLLEEQEQDKQNRTASVQSGRNTTITHRAEMKEHSPASASISKNRPLLQRNPVTSTAEKHSPLAGEKTAVTQIKKRDQESTKSSTGLTDIAATNNGNPLKENGKKQNNHVASEKDTKANIREASTTPGHVPGALNRPAENPVQGKKEVAKLNTAIKVTSITPSSMPHTNHKQVSDSRGPQANSIKTTYKTPSIVPGLIFLLLFIGIFSGLFWAFMHNTTEIVTSNDNNGLKHAPAINNTVKLEQHVTQPPVTIKPDQVETPAVEVTHPDPEAAQEHSGMAKENTNEDAIVAEASDTSDAEKSEPVIGNTTPDTDLNIDNTTSTITETKNFKAEIKKDAEGITIVLDAPEEEEVFKPEQQPAPTKTGTSNGVSSQNKIDQPASHRQLAAVDSKQVEQNNTTANMPDAAPEPRIISTEITHIVVKGDTLWHIAIKYVHNPYKYPELAKLSNIKNPDLIYPGDRVRIIKRKRASRATTE